MKKYIKLIFVFLIASCQNQNVEEGVSFFDDHLLFVSKEPFLNIYCQFEECGEWGGHEEYIKISKKNEEVFQLEYEKYSVNCDTFVTEFDGRGYITLPKKELAMSKVIEVGDKEKKAILDFSHDMVESKFQEIFPGHAGLTLSISNSDSTFDISTYGGSPDHYLRLIERLNL